MVSYLPRYFICHIHRYALICCWAIVCLCIRYASLYPATCLAVIAFILSICSTTFSIAIVSITISIVAMKTSITTLTSKSVLAKLFLTYTIAIIHYNFVVIVVSAIISVGYKCIPICPILAYKISIKVYLKILVVSFVCFSTTKHLILIVSLLSLVTKLLALVVILWCCRYSWVNGDNNFLWHGGLVIL